MFLSGAGERPGCVQHCIGQTAGSDGGEMACSKTESTNNLILLYSIVNSLFLPTGGSVWTEAGCQKGCYSKTEWRRLFQQLFWQKRRKEERGRG